MKKNKIIYWIVTGFVSLGFLMSSVMYLTKDPNLVEGFQKIGLPQYFLAILGFAKLFGALAIVNPWLPKLKEWAYAGFTFVLIGATWTHLATGTPFVAPIVFLTLLAVSYYYGIKLQTEKERLKTAMI